KEAGCSGFVNKKSIVGYVFKFGTTPISWCSKKKSVVALSTCEVEYIATAMAAYLAKHPVAHGRSKHIETKFHFLCDQVIADILTKPLKSIKFKELRSKLGVTSLTNL
ncbi:Copia protein, partial [Glycine soja]